MAETENNNGGSSDKKVVVTALPARAVPVEGWFRDCSREFLVGGEIHRPAVLKRLGMMQKSV